MTDETNNGKNQPDSPDEQDDSELNGFDEILFALSSGMRSKRFKEALALLLENFANDFRPNRKRLMWLTLGNWAFTLSVIGTVGFGAYLGLISTETTAALVGIVIGSLFRKGKNGQ